MTTDSQRAEALRDLRAAEAARVLGLLDVATLPRRARGWVRSGIASPAALALAASGARHGAPGPSVLVATLAAEYDVAIHDLGVARAVHAESVLAMLGHGGDFSGAVLELSNSVTDGLTGGLRTWWSRRRRR